MQNCEKVLPKNLKIASKFIIVEKKVRLRENVKLL